jgi:hypothetical protein
LTRRQNSSLSSQDPRTSDIQTHAAAAFSENQNFGAYSSGDGDGDRDVNGNVNETRCYAQLHIKDVMKSAALCAAQKNLRLQCRPPTSLDST